MKSKRTSLLLIGIGMGIGAAATAHAGVVVDSIERSRSTGKEGMKTSIQVQDGMARLESKDGHAVSIFKAETLYVLNQEDKTYMIIDAATMERMAQSANAAMERMRERMASMSPEQRAMMENMMKQAGGGMPGGGMPGAAPAKKAVLDAKATGSTEKAAGRNCKVWNVTRDTVLSSQLCVVAYGSLPGKDEFQLLTKKMQALFEKMPTQFRGQFDGNGISPDGIGNKIDGFPFIQRHYKNGALSDEEVVVTSWKEAKIPASQFDIPAAYTKREMPTMRQPK